MISFHAPTLLLAVLLWIMGLLLAVFSPRPYDGVWLAGCIIIIVGACIAGLAVRTRP